MKKKKDKSRLCSRCRNLIRDSYFDRPSLNYTKPEVVYQIRAVKFHIGYGKGQSWLRKMDLCKKCYGELLNILKEKGFDFWYMNYRDEDKELE